MNTTIFDAQSTFYFVSTENFMLVKEIMNETSYEFSKKVNVDSYVITAGQLIQDSKFLYYELKDKALEEFEIAVVVNNTDTVSIVFLGWDDKEKFLEILPAEENSGIAAQKLLKKERIEYE